MPSAPLPANERQRLEALERYEILDSLPETEYDDLATLAASICGVPMSVVSLIDSDRQWFKARHGVDIPQIPRSTALCSYAIHSDEVMEVPNATQDPRFVDNDLVTGDFGLRFYAGAPLITPDKYRLGTLCVVDRVPRHLTDEQRHALEALARQAVSQLELRRALKRAQIADAEKAMALSELEASNAVLERFVKHAPAAIAMLDSSWRYVAVSQRFLQSMNLSAPSVKGCDHFKICAFWPRSWRMAFEQAFQGEVQRGQGEVLHPDGRGEMFVDWEIYPWQGANGKSEGVIVLIDDVTPARRIEKLKSEFVSVVSHELRTPLTSIRGALGLLGGGVAGALPERAEQMIHIAHKNAERLVLLINDILDIEKIESGQMKFDLHTFDLGALLQSAVATNEHYAQTLGVSIVPPQQDGYAEPLYVRADESRLAQVMANLLSNAAKFTPNGGEVRVNLCEVGQGEDKRVRVEVRDQGPGVPPAFVNRLFERFAQADSSATRTQSGTGLGLAISRAIIEKMGGQIRYAPPRPGMSGATFWFELERVPAPTTPESLPQNSPDSEAV